MRRTVVLAALMASAALVSARADQGSGQGQSGVKVGLLTCSMTQKTNDVVYSHEKLDCTFDPYEGKTVQLTGRINSIGVDLKWTPSQELVWAVFAQSSDVSAADLTGTYAGVSASAAVGVGTGTKVLVGGTGQSVMLQPVVLAGSTGFGASTSIESFTLTKSGG